MKRLFGLLILLTSLSVSASSDWKLHAVYKKADAPAGKTYIAVVKEAGYDRGDWLVVFGTKNGKVHKRAFHFGGMSFYTYVGASNAGVDEFYKMVYKSLSKEELELTLTPRRENIGKTYKATYKVYESEASKRFALNVIQTVQDEKERLRDLENITSLKDFKARINLIQWDYGFSPGYDNYEFPFPTYDLQIEFSFDETLSNRELARAEILADGTDALSKKFRKGEKWYKDSGEAAVAVEEIIENGMNSDDWDWEVGEHAAYSTKASLFKDSTLAKAAKKYVRFEITNTSGFECEDGIYIWDSITWVLVDGSTFTYSPGTECD